MRIDKFLWCIRFYKTRSVSTDEIKKNHVLIGDSVCKSSREVRQGDVIGIKKNQIIYKIKVLQLPINRVSAKLVALYCTDCTEKEQYEILAQRREVQGYYRIKGEGRPTKKDRRAIEGFSSEKHCDEPDSGEDWEGFFNPINDPDEV